jgi:3-phytase
VSTSGDAADDPAIWVHPEDPARSVVLATDKEAGLGVYDLAGVRFQFVTDGKLNNVDVRYGFLLDGKRVDLVAASNRTDQTIAVYVIDPSTRRLSKVDARPIRVGIERAYGFALYRSRISGEYYAFVNDGAGATEQWRLFDNGEGRVDAERVRTLAHASGVEGMVADDRHGVVFIGEEDHGIWKFPAEPDADDEPVLIDRMGEHGHLTADVEGLALYHTADGGGYLIASSQGSDSFVVYDRTGDNDYRCTFTIAATGSIDAVSHTDGVAVSGAALGPTFAYGLFVAQDDDNAPDHQNFKLVTWEAIAAAADPPLAVDGKWNPRSVPTDE